MMLKTQTIRNEPMKKVIRTFLGTVALLTATQTLSSDYYAEILDVSAKKALFGSSFSLYATVKSSDVDCDHYVNWWEAVSEDGKLLFRRTLGHPHSREQPFNRGGSTSSIKEDTVFYVRAHIHPYGYSNQGMKGSAKSGFEPVTIPDGFAAELASTGERAGGCDASKD
jgi:hypothetical protein